MKNFMYTLLFATLLTSTAFANEKKDCCCCDHKEQTQNTEIQKPEQNLFALDRKFGNR